MTFTHMFPFESTSLLAPSPQIRLPIYICVVDFLRRVLSQSSEKELLQEAADAATQQPLSAPHIDPILAQTGVTGNLSHAWIRRHIYAFSTSSSLKELVKSIYYYSHSCLLEFWL